MQYCAGRPCKRKGRLSKPPFLRSAQNPPSPSCEARQGGEDGVQAIRTPQLALEHLRGESVEPERARDGLGDVPVVVGALDLAAVALDLDDEHRVGRDDDMALGAETAMKSAGRLKNTWILGGAGMKDIVKRVMDKDPMYPGDITYPPSIIGFGIQAAAGMV